jgi:GGDEF domain-containing protein
MSHEGQSLLARMQDEMASVEQRLADAETTDRATGLMNRREMERSIEARKTAGTPVVLLLFEFSGNLADEVIAQVAVRLGSQFRHNDIISRWNYNEFLVLFAGTPETAQNRASQIAPWVSGRYPLDNGEITEVKVEARLVETTEAVPL